MDLDPLNVHGGAGPHRFQHHLRVLAGQAVDDVGADADPVPAQLLHSLRSKQAVSCAAVDQPGRLLVDRLQAHLHPQIGPLFSSAR